jgi:hypothetical protein
MTRKERIVNEIGNWAVAVVGLTVLALAVAGLVGQLLS